MTRRSSILLSLAVGLGGAMLLVAPSEALAASRGAVSLGFRASEGAPLVQQQRRARSQHRARSRHSARAQRGARARPKQGSQRTERSTQRAQRSNRGARTRSNRGTQARTNRGVRARSNRGVQSKRSNRGVRQGARHRSSRGHRQGQTHRRSGHAAKHQSGRLRARRHEARERAQRRQNQRHARRQVQRHHRVKHRPHARHHVYHKRHGRRHWRPHRYQKVIVVRHRPVYYVRPRVVFRANIIIDLIGRSVYRDLRRYGGRLGYPGDPVARWEPYGEYGWILKVTQGGRPLAELVDFDGDRRIDDVWYYDETYYSDAGAW